MKARILTPLIFAVLTFSCNQTEELKKIQDESKTYSVNDIIVETIEDSKTANEPNNVPVEDTIRPAFEPDKTKGEYVGTFDKGQRNNLSSFSNKDVLLKWTKALFDSVHYAENGNDLIVELDKVKLSLANGANPNWINTQYKRVESTLHHFVSYVSYSNDPNVTKKGVEAIKLLFKHKVKLQYCDETILFWPIAQGKYEIVKILLENGASATSWPKNEIGTNYNMSPIEEATENGHEKIVDLLVSFGAKRLKEKDAVQIRFVEAVQNETIETLKKLVEKGASVNTRNLNDETALINVLDVFLPGIRAAKSYLKLLYLFELGADVNLKGKGFFGPTMPLHEAIIMTSLCFNSKNAERDLQNEKTFARLILKELIERGAHISGRDDDERTPLHIAAKFNNVVGAKMLIEAGCKLMDRDKDGKTPLDYAESAEMIELLKSHGAKEK